MSFAKILHINPDHVAPTARPMPEGKWFREHQSLLVSMANTHEGRHLLGIREGLPRVIRVGRSSITCALDMTPDGRLVKLSVFNTSIRYANRIRYFWKDFCRIAKAHYSHSEFGLHKWDITGRLAATVTTVTPDPHPETNTCDGRLIQNPAQQVWSTFYAIADSVFAIDNDSRASSNLTAGSTTDYWINAEHMIAMYLTTAVGTDVVSAGKQSLFFYVTDGINDLSATMSIGGANSFASNTSLSTGDWDAQTLTRYFDDETFADIITGGAAYYEFTMNAAGLSGVNGSGVSAYSMMTDAWMDDAEPTWGSGDSSRVTFWLAEDTGDTRQPELELTHEAAAAPTVSGMGMLI